MRKAKRATADSVLMDVAKGIGATLGALAGKATAASEAVKNSGVPEKLGLRKAVVRKRKTSKRKGRRTTKKSKSAKA
jgi:hypothetical protein